MPTCNDQRRNCVASEHNGCALSTWCLAHVVNKLTQWTSVINDELDDCTTWYIQVVIHSTVMVLNSCTAIECINMHAINTSAVDVESVDEGLREHNELNEWIVWYFIVPMVEQGIAPCMEAMTYTPVTPPHLWPLGLGKPALPLPSVQVSRAFIFLEGVSPSTQVAFESFFMCPCEPTSLVSNATGRSWACSCLAG